MFLNLFSGKDFFFNIKRGPALLRCCFISGKGSSRRISHVGRGEYKTAVFSLDDLPKPEKELQLFLNGIKALSLLPRLIETARADNYLKWYNFSAAMLD